MNTETDNAVAITDDIDMCYDTEAGTIYLHRFSDDKVSRQNFTTHIEAHKALAAGTVEWE